MAVILRTTLGSIGDRSRRNPGAGSRLDESVRPSGLPRPVDVCGAPYPAQLNAVGRDRAVFADVNIGGARFENYFSCIDIQNRMSGPRCQHAFVIRGEAAVARIALALGRFDDEVAFVLDRQIERIGGGLHRAGRCLSQHGTILNEGNLARRVLFQQQIAWGLAQIKDNGAEMLAEAGFPDAAKALNSDMIVQAGEAIKERLAEDPNLISKAIDQGLIAA